MTKKFCKTSLMATMLVLVSLAAQARSPMLKATFSANLTKLYFFSEDSTFKSDQPFSGGVVTIQTDVVDKSKNSIEVKAFFTLPRPVAVRVPFTDFKGSIDNKCGARSFAGRAKSPTNPDISVDVVVIDNKNYDYNKCPQEIAVPKTQVIVRETKKGEESFAQAVFAGEELKKQ